MSTTVSAEENIYSEIGNESYIPYSFFRRNTVCNFSSMHNEAPLTYFSKSQRRFSKIWFLNINFAHSASTILKVCGTIEPSEPFAY